MIAAIDMSGVKYTIDETTKKYVLRKIGRLDRFLPKHARKSVTVDVKLKQVNRDHGNKYEAEVILNVPDKRMTAKDSTVNMLAAVDIVEAKLLSQLRKYKQETIAHIGRKRTVSNR
ncbi:MAG: ribosome-associated translation inhibitor RaiA [Candidatus Microsaccharimonas sp.]